MKAIINTVLGVIFLILFFNVSFADELKIISDPVGANVILRDLGGTVTQKLGKTPYIGDVKELSQNYSKSGFFVLVIEKEGYISQSIMLSELLKSDLSVTINLEPVQEFTKYRQIDEMISELFESQRLVRSQMYDEALQKLKKLEQSDSNLSVIPEMIASTYYLKKDMKEALDWYKKAYRVNPANKDAFTMKVYLEKSMGIKNEN